MRKKKKRPIDALFPATRRGVLELTFGQSDREWFLSEMAERLGTSPSSLQRELENLAGTGLLKARREGRKMYYRAEPTASLFPELRSIIQKTVGAAPALRDALEPLRSGIRLALVYGSTAKGEDRATSDIDLMVVGDELTLEEIYRRVAPVEKRLGRTVNPTLYTPAEFRKRREGRNPFLQKVLAGPRIVLMGEENGIPGASEPR